VLEIDVIEGENKEIDVIAAKDEDSVNRVDDSKKGGKQVRDDWVR
jgi:hypothetical protein